MLSMKIYYTPVSQKWKQCKSWTTVCKTGRMWNCIFQFLKFFNGILLQGVRKILNYWTFTELQIKADEHKQYEQVWMYWDQIRNRCTVHCWIYRRAQTDASCLLDRHRHFYIKWCYGCHLEITMTNRKFDSVSRCIFTWRTFLLNFILIQYEMTDPQAFLNMVTQTRRSTTWVVISEQFLI